MRRPSTRWPIDFHSQETWDSILLILICMAAGFALVWAWEAGVTR